MKKQLKKPNVNPIQTTKIHQVEKEKEELLVTVVKYKGLTKEKDKRIGEMPS